MSDNPRRRNSINITLDDSYSGTIDLSDTYIFEVIVGAPERENMLGENSNSGSENTNVTAYTVSIDKTVEHVSRLVPEFSGGLDEKLEFFLNACELVEEITPLNNVDIMLRTILNKLKGQAYEIIKYEKIDSWVTLKTFLKNTYDKPKNAAYLQVELFSAKQKNKETLIEYVNRIRNLVQAVSEGSTQGKNKSDALAVQTNIREQALLVFLEGISDRIKIMVKSKNPSTLEQAIQIAIMEDKNTTPSELKQYNNINNYSKFKGGTQKFNKGNCHVCGKFGHYARDCRYNKGKTEVKVNTNRPIERTYMICDYCKKTNHTIDKCYKKKNADRRNKFKNDSNSGNGNQSQD